MKFGIVATVDNYSSKKVFLITLLSHYLMSEIDKSIFKKDVIEIYIEFICTRLLPGFETLQKLPKPKFKELQEICPPFGNGELIKSYNVLEYSCRLENEKYLAFIDASDEASLLMITDTIKKSLISIDKIPKRVKGFDKDKFQIFLKELLNQKNLYIKIKQFEYIFNRIEPDKKLKISDQEGGSEKEGRPVEELIVILLNKDNYLEKEWELRGLIPSTSSVIENMNVATNDFLEVLRNIEPGIVRTQVELTEKIIELVENIPWFDFDTEEREFIGDVIRPVIIKLGVNPDEFL